MSGEESISLAFPHVAAPSRYPRSVTARSEGNGEDLTPLVEYESESQAEVDPLVAMQSPSPRPPTHDQSVAPSRASTSYGGNPLGFQTHRHASSRQTAQGVCNLVGEAVGQAVSYATASVLTPHTGAPLAGATGHVLGNVVSQQFNDRICTHLTTSPRSVVASVEPEDDIAKNPTYPIVTATSSHYSWDPEPQDGSVLGIPVSETGTSTPILEQDRLAANATTLRLPPNPYVQDPATGYLVHRTQLLASRPPSV